MGVTMHNKLIRDKIPQIIEAAGKRCACEVLSEEEYLTFLDEKLNEELAEYQADKSMEELADLLEVMMAVAAARGHMWSEVEAIRSAKAEKRGGFDKRLKLKYVEE